MLHLPDLFRVSRESQRGVSLAYVLCVSYLCVSRFCVLIGARVHTRFDSFLRFHFFANVVSEHDCRVDGCLHPFLYPSFGVRLSVCVRAQRFGREVSLTLKE